ncbi:membrane protease YdiL (CAAX protease family) [Archangium gephyra]|uniref:CAAX amino terminal protease family protein n=1 Tax=Archangium gephyra TaxID=48 RepID=A0AAC8Q6Q0_9BACT|nr:CPBP family intramembrane glutamic endopeptidase [Archangium gephyra]AKJ01927.1 CAAX amino terminal protease family protein [Archangium gephyra]REG34737.1 membrane protease YdiL (CAAX protease family) [Archangium gephyra]
MSNDAQLLQNAPSRRRALSEAALVLVTVFVPGSLALLDLAPRLAVLCLLAVWGLALLRPWVDWRAGQRLRAVGAVLLFGLALGASTASGWLGGEGVVPPPRLGVRHTSVSVAGDGQATRKMVELTRVVPGAPADGRLEVGDRILAMEGQPLSASDPEEEFQERIRTAGGGASTEMRFTVERKGETREVTVPVGPAPNASPFKKPGSMLWLCLRALGVCLLVGLLLWRDGQGPAQLGLVREGLGRELLISVPVLVGAYAANIAVSIPIALIGIFLKLTDKEMVARKEVATGLVEMGLSVPVFAAAMVLVAGFEELAFRGFLVPRLKVLLGNWPAAVVLSAVLFGLGHFYEGTLAVAQTAVLGAYFGFVFVFVRRFRLPSVMLAHAAFNTINFTLMIWLQRSGLLEKLAGQRPPAP